MLTIEIVTGPYMCTSVERFISTWSPEDCYDRFGFWGDSGPTFLAKRIREGHRAFVAQQDGQVIGLLDHAPDGDATTFGVLVQAHARKRGVGTSLVSAFLNGMTGPVTAECRFANRAAVALLRKCGLRRTWISAGECGWGT